MPELSHAMLQEMAESGAKVVCAQAVEWARRSGIAIYARSTFDALSGARQSVVRRPEPGEQLLARAVVAESSVAYAVLRDVSELDSLFAELASAKLPIKDLALSDRGASFVVPLLNTPDFRDIARRLRLCAPSLVLEQGVAVVSVVGDGLAASVEPLVRFRAALAAVGAAARMTTATPLRIGAVIDGAHRDEAQRALHAAFIERA
jgi:aspartate kinase